LLEKEAFGIRLQMTISLVRRRCCWMLACLLACALHVSSLMRFNIPSARASFSFALAEETCQGWLLQVWFLLPLMMLSYVKPGRRQRTAQDGVRDMRGKVSKASE